MDTDVKDLEWSKVVRIRLSSGEVFTGWWRGDRVFDGIGGLSLSELVKGVNVDNMVTIKLGEGQGYMERELEPEEVIDLHNLVSKMGLIRHNALRRLENYLFDNNGVFR